LDWTEILKVAGLSGDNPSDAGSREFSGWVGTVFGARNQAFAMF
jgi:hypothetical protein